MRARRQRAMRREQARRGARPRVVLATRLFTPEPAAAAFREEALAHALQEAGADVRVLTTRDPAHPAGTDRVRSVSRFPVKRDAKGQVRGYASYLSFDLPLALRLLLTRRMDVIVSEPPPTTGCVVMALAALRRAPFVFYAADIWSDATDSVSGVPGPVRRAVRWAETTVWRRAARVLTISPGVDARVRELGGPRVRTVMVGNGIDTDTFAPAAGDPGDGAASDGAATDGVTMVGSRPPVLVYAGTVSEWQGAQVLVDGFALIRAEHPDARLVFFSEGSGREALERHVREQGIAGVELRDRVPPAEVAAHLRTARAGLSSITPGQGYEFALPTKIYAATASGTPVIHAGAGAAADRIREAGLGWACAYDAEAVADAMRAALRGEGAPSPAHLRQWTLANASLEGCAAQAARAVLDATAPTGQGSAGAVHLDQP